MSEACGLLVTAKLVKPLDGDAPHLDSLLEYAMSLHHHAGEPGYKVDRALPAPPMGAIPIPIGRKRLGPWLVGCCSNPILGRVHAEGVQYINKRIGVEKAALLAENARHVVATTNSWTKSWRVPHRTRLVDKVCWFAFGNRKILLKTLKSHVRFIGRKRSVGDGMVGDWTVDKLDHDYSWFAPSEHGTVLMRTLPAGDWLPDDLVGFKQDFGGVCPPYWHPERYSEIVVPC